MKIKKDGTVLNVSKGAYDALFADMGYILDEAGKGSTPLENAQKKDIYMAPQPLKESLKPEIDEVPFGSIIESTAEEDYELVLEDMSAQELIEYAGEYGIDVEGLNTKKEMLSKIKKILEG